ncbi:hypothetical protein [Pedobacter alluvionis]|uniref:Uncharacterized protein n=1 Tax=Pedobacter alluvionis TaxID=475253 RepID=A0A497Y0J7_9SPHI|nr:hypothetical protein [Pedobacter alluvionis]RLJ75176.1 hypothetical protein BCL90_3527 [Pedobacter alluvionis]TFB30278.1 hypothetical protein E3V97_19105 [Pedobacter alluvionis]
MAALEQDLFQHVISLGKQAVDSLKAGNMDDFYRLSEEAWRKFPEPRSSWNQEYNFCKMCFKHCMNNKNYTIAKVWLNRMIENNNHLHLSEYEVQHNQARYFFETGNYGDAYEKWQYVTKDAGFRYFENEDPKYLDFYKNPDKFIH